MEPPNRSETLDLAALGCQIALGLHLLQTRKVPRADLTPAQDAVNIRDSANIPSTRETFATGVADSQECILSPMHCLIVNLSFMA
jgi:hypothetical protein